MGILWFLFGFCTGYGLHALLTRRWKQKAIAHYDQAEEALKSFVGKRKLISETTLPNRVKWALRDIGIKSLVDLAETSEAELLRGPQIGRASVNKIKELLAEYGMKLAD